MMLDEALVFGEHEFGDAMTPLQIKSLNSSGGSSKSTPYRGDRHRTANGRDGELARALCGVKRDIWLSTRSTLDMESTVTVRNPHIFIDGMLARASNDTPALAAIHREALAACAAAEAQRYAHGVKDDPLGRESLYTIALGIDWMDMNRVKQLTLSIIAARTWLRKQGITAPTPADLTRAVAAARPFYAEVVPADADGLDFEAIAGYSLAHRAEKLAPEDAALVLGRPVLGAQAFESSESGETLTLCERGKKQPTFTVTRRGEDVIVTSQRGSVKLHAPGERRQLVASLDAEGLPHLRITYASTRDELRHDLLVTPDNLLATTRRALTPTAAKLRSDEWRANLQYRIVQGNQARLHEMARHGYAFTIVGDFVSSATELADRLEALGADVTALRAATVGLSGYDGTSWYAVADAPGYVDVHQGVVDAAAAIVPSIAHHAEDASGSEVRVSNATDPVFVGKPLPRDVDTLR